MAENLLRLKNLLRAYALRSRSHLDLPPPRIAGTNVAQAMQPASGDEINRARPGLVAVALRHAHIDRKVSAARERHDVIDRQAPAPILLGPTIDADPPGEAAAGGIQSDATSAACAAIPERAATRARSTA